MKFSLRASLAVVGLLVTVATVGSLSIQATAIKVYNIGGQAYQDIVLKKDFVADVAPPPINLVQPYALALESMSFHRTSEKNLDRLGQLRSEYQQRKAFWLQSTLPSAMRERLERTVFPSTDKFWNIVENQLKPAIKDRDKPAIAIASQNLRDGFAEHQAIMAALVKAANVSVKTEETQALESASRLVLSGSAAALAAIVILVAGLLMVLRRAITPILAMSRAMRQLAEGELNLAIPYTARRDEIGVMASSVEVFKTAAVAKARLEADAERLRQESDLERQAIQREAEAAAEEKLRRATNGLARGLHDLASGDLTVELADQFAAEFEGLRHDFNQAVGQLGALLGDIASSAGAFGSATREISNDSAKLSSRTEQQAASLEETAAALDQITGNVTSASERAQEARKIADIANRSAERSEDIVGRAVSAMSRIEQSSGQMSNIVGAIDEIAFQTNLLALNAGVEAARAGEAGKGFAVVAQEVRELAQRSAKEAREIKHLISSSNAEVEAGVRFVQDAGQSLKDIGGQIREIHQLIEAIATSAREQAVGLAEINSSVNMMDQMTQQNAIMVVQTSEASTSLAEEAVRLGELLARFRYPDRRDHGDNSAVGAITLHVA
jgi:methyl-accepting chemotaxis protein